MSGQRHTPAALYPQGKDLQYLVNRRLGGPQSRSGHRLEEKSSCLCRGLNLDCWLSYLYLLISRKYLHFLHHHVDPEIGNSLILPNFDIYLQVYIA
jgi:hypothetical protein